MTEGTPSGCYEKVMDSCLAVVDVAEECYNKNKNHWGHAQANELCKEVNAAIGECIGQILCPVEHEQMKKEPSVETVSQFKKCTSHEWESCWRSE